MYHMFFNAYAVVTNNGVAISAYYVYLYSIYSLQIESSLIHNYALPLRG
jgi:hypothetical protein